MSSLRERVRYPRFFLFIVIIILVYVGVRIVGLEFLERTLQPLGYVGTFLSGVLYVYGFTAPVATALLIAVADIHPLLPAALVAGAGALLGDILIFSFVRQLFAHELERLGRTGWVRKLSVQTWFRYTQKYVLPVMGFIVIATPLPDEIGIMLLAGLPAVSTRTFAVASFLLNTAGIMIVLLIGQSVV